jgi:hypothetical protein
MLEPTITQNSALYFAHHNIAIDSKKPQRGFQARIGRLLNLRRRSVSEPVHVLRLPIGQR